QPLFEHRGFHHLAEYRRVRALRHAVHAAHAIRRDELGDVGSDVAEVAECAGGGWDYTARGLVVGRQPAFGETAVVGAHDSFVEVGDINHVGADIFEARLKWNRCGHWIVPPASITRNAALAWSDAAVDCITSRGTSNTS